MKPLVTFGRMEGTLADGRSCDVFVGGARVGVIEVNAIGKWTGTASGTDILSVASYSVDVDEEYGIDASKEYDTLKGARDAVRRAVRRTCGNGSDK